MSHTRTQKHTGRTPAQIIYRVSGVTLLLNLLLSAAKLVAGLIGSSGAMVADAVHSASDAFTTILVMIGTHISAAPADADHPYGHERMECIISLLLALILLGVGAVIGWNGVRTLFETQEDPTPPEWIALVAAAVSILTKEAMYHYTVHAAKRVGSLSLKADAWHHRSDALSSIGSLAGIGGAMLGWYQADALAAAIISVLIMKVAFDIGKDTLNRLVDHAAPAAVQGAICKAALAQPGVLSVDLLRTRLFGPRIYADLEIGADGDLTLWESHAIAEQVRDAILLELPDLKTCTVHVNPYRHNRT